MEEWNLLFFRPAFFRPAPEGAIKALSWK